MPRSHNSWSRSDEKLMPREAMTISCSRISGTCAQTDFPFLTTTRSLFFPMYRPKPRDKQLRAVLGSEQDNRPVVRKHRVIDCWQR